MKRIFCLQIIVVAFSSVADSMPRACDKAPSDDDKTLFCLDSTRLNSVARVKYDNQWRAICADVWPKEGADAVCMEQHGSDAVRAQFEPISDSTTEQLAFVNWDMMNKTDYTCGRSCIKLIHRKACTSNRVGRVDCHGIRLAKQEGRKGMLETFVNNTWGSVCPLTWDIAEADVACNQLYTCPAKSALTSTHYLGFNASKRPINVQYYACSGKEASLDNCVVALAPEGYEMCQKNDPRRAGISCRSNCNKPIQTDNVIVKPDREEYAPGTDVKISCAPGYRPEAGDAEKTLRCHSNCQWSEQTLTCKPGCDPPSEVHNATFLPSVDFYFVGTTVTYTCDTRFQLAGRPTVTCGVDQQWSTLPECIDNIQAKRDKLGADVGTLGSLPAVVASIVMGAALLIALMFFVVLVLRRAADPIEYEESIYDTSQKEEESEMEDVKESEMTDIEIKITNVADEVPN